MDGIINVYKEKGYTSFDVVAKLRGILKQKKIGHTGTLDPDAQGVLPVCLGKATRVCDLLTDKEKEYEAVLLLGRTTDTQDTTGQTLKELPVTCTREEVCAAIAGFVGPYDQIPPMYSALKVNGQKLCNLARAGIEVERKPRRITIHAIDILEMELPRVKLRVRCSKGTYIRTLCHDIGETLSCGGCMEELLRTKVGQFTAGEAHRLDEIEQAVAEGRLESYIAPVDSVFTGYPAVRIREGFDKLLYNGNPLPATACMEPVKKTGADRLRVYDAGDRFIGIYEWNGQRLKPVKLFL